MASNMDIKNFDSCEHRIRQLVIKAAQEIRKAKGLPEEKNISTLFDETAPLLGVAVKQISSIDMPRMPFSYELTDNKTGDFVIPRKDCPKCGEKKSMVLAPICASCKDAEGGKYKSLWECLKCGEKEVSEKAFVQWLDELGIDFKSGMKADMGIKTATDEGLK
jgi:hypothetical protein